MCFRCFISLALSVERGSVVLNVHAHLIMRTRERFDLCYQICFHLLVLCPLLIKSYSVNKNIAVIDKNLKTFDMLFNLIFLTQSNSLEQKWKHIPHVFSLRTSQWETTKASLTKRPHTIFPSMSHPLRWSYLHFSLGVKIWIRHETCEEWGIKAEHRKWEEQPQVLNK